MFPENNENSDNNSPTPAQEEAPAAVSLEALRAGKVHISEISRQERNRLAKEERESLADEDAIEAWDTYGWRTQPFFLKKFRDGSEKPWIDHKEFLHNVKNFTPIQNERMRHLAQEKSALEQEVEKLRSDQRRTNELLRLKAEKDIRKEEMILDAEMREAEEIGDVKRFVAAHEQKAQTAKEKEMLKEFQPQQSQPASIPQADIIAFKARNPWFEEDEVMQAYAEKRDVVLRQTYPYITPSEHLQMVENDVKKKFPHAFKNEGVANPYAVEGARNSGSAVSKEGAGLTFEQLPEEERLIAQQLLKKGMSKAQFMADYNKSSYAKGNGRLNRY